MGTELAEPVRRLVDELARLPGVGKKSAQRLAFHLLKGSLEDAQHLADAVLEVKARMTLCGACYGFTDRDPCAICDDPGRERSLICVVQEPGDIYAIERAGGYRGLYHVLLGSLSPIRGIGPDELKLAELAERVRDSEVEEIIVATNPDVEGEATAAFIQRLLKPLGVRVSRIGFGLPVGSSLEYTDEVTMARALEGRRDI